MSFKNGHDEPPMDQEICPVCELFDCECKEGIDGEDI